MQQFGKLPYGYDHKYVYSEIGYNLKMTDLQAAIGVAQIDKLPEFMTKRKENFQYLYDCLKDFEDYFILPQATESSDPCWFGFPLTINNHAVKRTEFIRYLNDKGIATRLLFSGNVTKQPYFLEYSINHRLASSLINTDTIMNDTFWIGIYPALRREHIDWVVSSVGKYIKDHVKS